MVWIEKKLDIGTLVKHHTYGPGKVVEFDPRTNDDSWWVIIKFDFYEKPKTILEGRKCPPYDSKSWISKQHLTVISQNERLELGKKFIKPIERNKSRKIRVSNQDLISYSYSVLEKIRLEIVGDLMEGYFDNQDTDHIVMMEKLRYIENEMKRRDYLDNPLNVVENKYTDEEGWEFFSKLGN